MIEVTGETGSTNADLLARGREWPEGDWLVAARQSAGRGRLGRVWQDGAGNFMGSTVVHLAPADPPAPSLALVAGLAVHGAVRARLPALPGVLLKWPNDLLVGGAKLAGVLLERADDVVVVGIGVNLASAPALPDRDSVALADFASAPPRELFAAELAASFASELSAWRAAGLAPVIARWLAAAHPIGTPLAINAGAPDAQSGTFAGLDANGALLLALADGTRRTIHAGEATLA